MEINNIEKKNNLENINEKDNNQNNFLLTTIGKTVNTAIDIGIRTLLPDFVEDQVINIKDNLINYGLKDGINRTIQEAIDLGKSTIGILTGNFENINQMQNAIQTGGVIDGISTVFDTAVNAIKNKGIINSTIANILKQGKNVILNNIESNIEKTFTNQIKSMQYTEKYINNWKQYYNNKDFEGMEKEYTKINKELKNLVPIEKTINEAREIENIHNLIKNNGKNFDLTTEQLELAKKL